MFIEELNFDRYLPLVFKMQKNNRVNEIFQPIIKCLLKQNSGLILISLNIVYVILVSSLVDLDYIRGFELICNYLEQKY